MEYFKITHKNRYYEQYINLLKTVSISNFFEEYRTEKGSGVEFNKPKPSFSNFAIRSKEIVKEIDVYFEQNLFEIKEKKLFIYNLLLSVENYGSGVIYSITHSGVDKVNIFSKYGVKVNGDITEEMILSELPNFPEFKKNIILKIIEFRQELLKEVNEYDKELKSTGSKVTKVKFTGLYTNIKENETFKNMPIISKHYLPLIDGLKKRVKNDEIPNNEIKLYWQNLRTQIESDLYDIGKLHNDETIEFCKKRIFPLIDIEIKKAEQTISPQQITKLNQSEGIELSKKKSKQNIISTLNYQLGRISHLFQEQIDKNHFKYNFYINDNDVNFLNTNTLERYLTETQIHNTSFLKGIVQKCLEIHNLWNNEIAPAVHGEKKEPKPNLTGDNYYFTIHNDHWTAYHRNKKSIEEFRSNFENNYTILSCYKIALRCSSIINCITAAFEEIKEYVEEINVVEQIRNSESKKEAPIIDQSKHNDIILSTIEDYLEPLKSYFNDSDYKTLIKELKLYFEKGSFSKSESVISLKNRPNKKFIGWQLNQIYRNCKDDNSKLPIEYLRFGKQRISIFKDVKFDESNYLKSNLYKYYTQKVSKT